MKIAKIFGISLKIDPLLVAMALPAAFMGMLPALLITFVTILLHEFFHAAVGAAFGRKATEIELMPFGGVARIGEGNGSCLAEFLVAAAGPAINLTLAGALIMLVRNNPDLARPLRLWIGANIVIGLFNLLPAYPMDGGRMLRAVLVPIIGEKIASKIAAYLGAALGVCMVLVSVVSAFYGNPLNITIIGVGAFVFFEAWKARREWPYVALKRAGSKRERVRKRRILPERRVAAGAGVKAHELLGEFSPNRYHTVTVLDDDMHVVGTVGESEIVEAVIEKGEDITIGTLAGNVDIRR